MQANSTSQSGIFNLRALAALMLFSLGVFLGLLSLSATPAAETIRETASDWSIVSSPNSRPTPTDNFPFNVTCVSASNCWAVGYYDNRSAYQTLIEHWDGTSWTVVTSPNTSVTQHNLLRGVTCVSASDCWAAGSYYDGSFYQTLIERWDGTSWTIVTSPSTSAAQYNYLLGVTCVSATECWAVGYYSNGSGIPQTLIERWNGTSWAIITSPNTSTSQENILYAITCVSGSDCWAVGSDVNGITGFYQTLIERWNGVSWTIVSSPNALLTQDNYLYDITCASTTECWAVGYSNNGIADQTLIERWDGNSWTVVSSPNTMITENNRLYGVRCASTSECWSVGYFNNGSTDQTLIERWDGSSWTIVTSPNTDALQNNTLKGVMCAPASDCWAVGFYYNDNVQQSLIERWDGNSWTIISSANTSAPQNNTLLGMTCVSASDCWAVASYYNGSVQQTLIEHWNGNVWTIVDSPNTSNTQSNILYDVTCVSASDCWAIGYYFNDSAFQPLIEHWDGTSWTIINSPGTAVSQNNFLSDVTCVSASQCWAVGFYDNDGVYQTLIERWDGNSWTIVSSPNTNISLQNRLYGLTCSSASDCWAIGRYFNGLALQTLIEHWDGISWTIVTSPNTDSLQENVLWGVTCASTSECWAVGSSGSGSGTGQPLIERWDGNAWEIVPSPHPTEEAQYNYNFLRSVTCASSSDCWAVGYYFNDGVNRTLIQRWDGTSWAMVSSPNTSATQSNFLFGVTCLSASDCWAAGYYTDDSGIFQTLTEHYIASLPPIPTSVVSRKLHGATPHDVDLPLSGTPGIECRNTSDTNADKHEVVFLFETPVTFSGASVTPASSPAGMTAELDGTPTTNGNEASVKLKNVSDAQTITVKLLNASAGSTTVPEISVQMGVLTGDVNASGVVTSGDTNLCKAQALQSVTIDNFRNDINASGAITTGDVNLIKQNALSQLSSPP